VEILVEPFLFVNRRRSLFSFVFVSLSPHGTTFGVSGGSAVVVAADESIKLED
jgi:hypothetical protein